MAQGAMAGGALPPFARATRIIHHTKPPAAHGTPISLPNLALVCTHHRMTPIQAVVRCVSSGQCSSSLSQLVASRQLPVGSLGQPALEVDEGQLSRPVAAALTIVGPLRASDVTGSIRVRVCGVWGLDGGRTGCYLYLVR